jgi:lipid II:glycine glycyltransferase (peptidoglycan interpeptide bridge formation enzyme)
LFRSGEYTAVTGAPAWDETIAALPEAHVLQTSEWGRVKIENGWQPTQWAWWDEQGQVRAAALILQRRLSASRWIKNLGVMYLPKGPLLDWSNVALRRQVLRDLASLGRRNGSIFIKLDPDVAIGTGVPGEAEAETCEVGESVLKDLQATGWRLSDEQVQFRNTVLIDLTPDLDQLLANMKQKTRYNIRLAERKGVTVRAGGVSDLEMLYKLYVETSVRDDFVIRDWGYYQALWSTMLDARLAEPLIAEVQGQPVGGVVIFRFAGRAWYMQGMSSLAHREKMPNYLLQWEAIRRSKAAGCRVYDLWGAPDEFSEGDSMWGVYRFKEGLGGRVVRHIGAWDLPIRLVGYKIYTQVLPSVLEVLRRKGKQRARRLAG